MNTEYGVDPKAAHRAAKLFRLNLLVIGVGTLVACFLVISAVAIGGLIFALSYTSTLNKIDDTVTDIKLILDPTAKALTEPRDMRQLRESRAPVTDNAIENLIRMLAKLAGLEEQALVVMDQGIGLMQRADTMLQRAERAAVAMATFAPALPDPADPADPDDPTDPGEPVWKPTRHAPLHVAAAP
jgi:hypothetical protein